MATSQASSMHMFALPPPALIEQKTGDTVSMAPTVSLSVSRSKKRRTSQQRLPETTVTLPPPPTRTRKIIQMKPTPASTTTTTPSPSSSPPSSTPSTTTTTTPNIASGSKSTNPRNTQKTFTAKPSSTPQPNVATTSRKVARKTAHSLIERRRRSKMNAEFESLKSLVPACKGVEMHKLAILQASIEYVRYLEGCVKELQKAAGVRCDPPPVLSPRMNTNTNNGGEEEDEDSAEDVEMEMREMEMREPERPLSQQQTPKEEYSSYMYATNTPSSAASVASAASPDFGPIHSATTSPVFTHPAKGISLPSISPVLFPQPCRSPMEATAGALLLLADEGRRVERPVPSRGMSVKDLLSS